MQSISRNQLLTFLFVLILTISSISIITHAKNSSSETTFEYSYSVNNMYFSGTYVGETSNGIPSGKGRFDTDSDSSSFFSYSGEFKNGLPDGEGTYTYPDNRYLECTFSSGIPTGEGTITYPDHSYSTVTFNTVGIPYGPANIYSADDELINCDFYNNGELLTTLMESAQQINYRELYQNPNDYYGIVLKIKGTILFVYEDESSCTFKIRDQKNNIYWGKYTNTSFNSYNQAIMPTLRTGDILTLYAFSKGLTNYSCTGDIDSHNILLPEVSAITAQLDDESLNYNSLSYNYDKILRFPYNYVKKTNTIKGHITNMVRHKGKTYIKISDSDNNIYYVLPKKKKEIQSLMPGDLILINGYYQGLFKEYHSGTKETANLRLLFKATESIEILNTDYMTEE